MLYKNIMPRRARRLSNLLMGCATLALTTAATAQDTTPKEDIEEIMISGKLTRYSATKSDTPVFETSRSISIEDQQALRDKGALELADAYVYTAGVFGETFGVATRGDWVKVRGLDVPEYRDSLQALFGNYNNTRSDIYTLEQVELLKGPSSVLYGQGSPGGLINVVSKRPKEDFQGEIIADYGTFDRKQIAADFTGNIDENGKFLYRMVALYRDSDTQINHVENNAVVIAPSLTWRPSDATNITILANYQEQTGDTAAQFLPVDGTLRPAPNGEFIPFDTYLGEPEFNRYDRETYSATLLASHDISANWTTELTARYTKGEADYRQAWPAFIGGTRYVDANGTVARTFYQSDASSEQFAIDGRIKGIFETGALEHNILVGVDYQNVKTENDYYYAFAPVGFFINVFNPVYGNVPTVDQLGPYFDFPASKNNQIGISIQDQIRYDKWLFTLGIRGDKVNSDTGTVEQDDENISLSFGGMYQFENGLSPYASYSESFQPVVGTLFDGSAFAPEQGKQYEVGVKYQIPGTQSLITAAYFDIEQTNIRTADPTNVGFQVQEGDVKIKGFEIEANAQFGDFNIDANYSYLDTETTAGFRLNSVPDHQASTWIGWRPTGKLSGFKAGFGLRYVGESWGGADILRTPDYLLADAMIGYETEHWDLTVNARNLTNKEYLSTCLARGDCFVGEERTVVARLAYKF